MILPQEVEVRNAKYPAAEVNIHRNPKGAANEVLCGCEVAPHLLLLNPFPNTAPLALVPELAGKAANHRQHRLVDAPCNGLRMVHAFGMLKPPPGREQRAYSFP